MTSYFQGILKQEETIIPLCLTIHLMSKTRQIKKSTTFIKIIDSHDIKLFLLYLTKVLYLGVQSSFTSLVICFIEV